jgi:hypothetical protein
MKLIIESACDSIRLRLEDSFGDVQYEQYCGDEDIFSGGLSWSIGEVVKRVSGNTVEIIHDEVY